MLAFGKLRTVTSCLLSKYTKNQSLVKFTTYKSFQEMQIFSLIKYQD